VLKASLTLHVSEIEPTDIDRIACWCVVELVWSVTEYFPIEEHWSIFASIGSNKIFTNHINTNSCRANILLSSSINNTIFVPCYWARAEV
jgi:hypothetical protein